MGTPRRRSSKRLLTWSVPLVVVGLLLAVGADRASSQGSLSPIEELAGISSGAFDYALGDDGGLSFVRGDLSLPQLAGVVSDGDVAEGVMAFLSGHPEAFRLGEAPSGIEIESVVVDELGITHLVFRQVFRGIPVAGGEIRVHLSRDRTAATAISSQLVPGVELDSVEPTLGSFRAEQLAASILRNGTVGQPTRLVVAEITDPISGLRQFRLAWEVVLVDDQLPAWTLYVIDAGDGALIGVQDLLNTNRDRATYTAEHQRVLPGVLARSEGDPASDDRDTDRAHNYAGQTYSYFADTYGRDSYDDDGASLISTVHYGQSYYNAFWNGQQVAYGDGMAVRDVVAHEWTHAVTQHTAGLIYEWQSGAMNESFSDVFGVMVDRNDWFVGDGLPGSVLAGRPGIRSMADPPSLGQPDHADDWVETCSDNEGVHTNSGLTNKAYYNIATEIGKARAERIFFRALVYYLGPEASLNDLRLAALQAADDLYGANSAEEAAVDSGLAAVGIDGQWEPESNDCTCAFTTVLSDRGLFGDPLESLDIAATLYQVRDQILPTSEAGEFYRSFFDEHTAAISDAVEGDARLRALGSDLLRESLGGFVALVNGRGDEVTITSQMVSTAAAFLHGVADADAAQGDGRLATAIAAELALIDIDQLSGMTFDGAWEYLSGLRAGDTQARVTRATGPFPIVEIGGADGDDETAVDANASIAYDPVDERYLTVWLSARRADSSSDGFDVFGRFLNKEGFPTGAEFRISDDNSAAISGSPAVEAGSGGFLVAWTRQGSNCAVVGQVVTNARSRADFLVASGSVPMHSPSVAYSTGEERFLVAYVAGSDYLPPSLFGTDTAKCGNSATSTSRIESVAYRVVGSHGNLSATRRVVVSGKGRGAFRPDVEYNVWSNQFLVAWEDRSRANANPARFDVFGQRIVGTGSARAGGRLMITKGGKYDTEAPWTPSPAVGAGRNGYLVAYFTRNTSGDGVEWRTLGRLVTRRGAPAGLVRLTRMTFANDHPGDEPSGQLAVAYDSRKRRYLVAQAAHMESLFGYFPTVTALQVTIGGDVRNLNGTVRRGIGVGEALDWGIDLQTNPAIAAYPNKAGLPNFVVAYVRHHPGGQEKDLNIWASAMKAKKG